MFSIMFQMYYFNGNSFQEFLINCGLTANFLSVYINYLKILKKKLSLTNQCIFLINFVLFLNPKIIQFAKNLITSSLHMVIFG